MKSSIREVWILPGEYAAATQCPADWRGVLLNIPSDEGKGWVNLAWRFKRNSSKERPHIAVSREPDNRQQSRKT